MTRITHTPWGTPDHQQCIAQGITLVCTPSHGGYVLSPEANAKVPLAWQRASWEGQGLRGYYEEDCDWTIVVCAYPGLFDEATRTRARAIFDAWIKPKLGPREVVA